MKDGDRPIDSSPAQSTARERPEWVECGRQQRPSVGLPQAAHISTH
jgi:hypothetical protein